MISFDDVPSLGGVQAFDDVPSPGGMQEPSSEDGSDLGFAALPQFGVRVPSLGGMQEPAVDDGWGLGFAALPQPGRQRRRSLAGDVAGADASSPSASSTRPIFEGTLHRSRAHTLHAREVRAKYHEVRTVFLLGATFPQPNRAKSRFPARCEIYYARSLGVTSKW